MRAFIVSATALVALGGAAGALDDFRCTVTPVRDGDTLECGERVIRLQGIDAPESDQPYGAHATKALTARVDGVRIRVDTKGRGSYGRIIGVVYTDDENVNRWLVRNGHAWEYDLYSQDQALGRLERAARQANVGLWKASTPVPPWRWRQNESGSSLSGGGDKDCGDFATQQAAQSFFDAHQPGDPHRLDGDGDGKACQSLP